MSNTKSGRDCVPWGTVAPTTWMANVKSHFGVCLSSESGLWPEFQHHPSPPNWMITREFPESYPPLVIFKSTFEMYFKCILSYLPRYFVIQFSSIAQSCPTLCDSMECSMPGFTIHHQLPGACSNSGPSSRWCHPTISSSVFHLSQHQGLFQWVSSSHQVAKVLEFQFQLQHQSFQWIFGTDFL